MSKTDLKKMIEDAARERGIEPHVLTNAIQSGISFAAREKTGQSNLRAAFDKETESFALYQVKTVQETIENPDCGISPEDARKYAPEPNIGDEVLVPYPFPDLGRIAAHATRKIMKKNLEEIESDHKQEEMMRDRFKLVVAVVRSKNDLDEYICDVADTPALLPRKEQAFRESFKAGEVIKTVIVDVERRGRDLHHILSRTHPLLLRFLLTREVPEIAEGLVEIKSIARDTAGRSKVAVASVGGNIDAEGACIGPGGSRIMRITEELKGENIDIIPWSENPEKLIASSLKPAKVKSVKCDFKKFEADVELEPNQQSIAVGKKGLNIRLASRLTHWTIRVA